MAKFCTLCHFVLGKFEILALLEHILLMFFSCFQQVRNRKATMNRFLTKFAHKSGPPVRHSTEFPADIYERGALHCSPMPFKSRTHLLFRRNWICQFAVILKLCSVYNIAQE